MQLTNLVNALLVGSAIAQPIAHLHHQHAKRDVVVVTETVIVTANGNDQTIDYVHADATSTSSSATTTALAQVAPTTTTSYTPTSTSATSTEAEAESEEETTSSAAASTATSDSSDDDDSSFTAGTKGITYSPYTSSGECKSASEVASDLSELTSYGLIRLYGVDCNQVENVFKAKADGQKLFLGIYYVDAIADAVSTISSAVKSYGSWDDVHTISVGNELVNAGSASVAQIGEYVSTAKSALTSAGYSGPIVSVDTHVAIIDNPGLCEFSDYIAFNAHSYWDGTIYPEGAGAWLLLQMQRVWTACGGEKDVLCVETGWPTQGDNNGVAIPSKANQKTAISSISSSCGDSAVAFNAFDDLWKNPGSKNVEQYWGIY